jgi:virulence factor
MQTLIERLKNIRKQSYLKLNFNKKYAFVGIGSHSINNLYPVLSYLRINLKYIVTQSSKNAETIDHNFPNVIGTNDLDAVLNDPEISGVFICVKPTAHFGLVKKVLLAGKNVFVEKPPCTTLEEMNELIEIEKKSKGICLVGLQKRYAPVNLKMKSLINSASTYNYRYLTGPYPEGDPFLDLFIHPIDLVNYLFGEVEVVSVLKQKNYNSITLLLQLSHKNSTIGTIELSTAYSWKTATEEMVLNTKNGIYKSSNTENLLFEPKHGQIFSLPLEKILNKQSTSIALIQKNSFSPTIENNEIYSSGYYNELFNFIKLCETGKGSNHSSLTQCLSTYQLITKIRN